MTNQSPRPQRAQFLAERALEAAFVAGAGLIIYGIWDIYHPAAFIVAGAFLLCGAFMIARKSA